MLQNSAHLQKKLVIYINRSFHYGLSRSTVQMENYNAAKIEKKKRETPEKSGH